MNKYNFEINFNVEFPKNLLEKPINAQGRPLTEDKYDICFHYTLSFMQLFNLKLLKYLKRMYFLDYMKFYDTEGYGGTWIENTIYCVYKDYYTEYDVLRTLVEEFSSILLLNNPFTKNEEKEWFNCLPKNFKYSGTGIEVLNQQNLLDNNKNLFNNGFINKYAMSSFENDYNQIFVYIFLRKNELNKIIKKYKLINKKVEIIKNWLEKIK